MWGCGKVMGEYSNDRIDETVREARAGGWKELVLGSHNLRDSDLEQLGREEGCSGLQSLELSWCRWITDAGLEAIGKGCVGLQSLDVSWCRKIANTGLAAFGKGCVGLRSLSVCGCNEITDAGLAAIGKCCAGLRLLNVGWCGAITDAGLAAIGECCAGLQSLDVSLCWEITDAGLEAIGKGCVELQSLDVRWCKEITDAGLLAIGKGCPGLQSLVVRSCKKITNAGLGQLGRLLPPVGKLDRLVVDDVPGLGLPEEVARSGDARRILTAVREILAGKGKALLEVKVVVLGDGEVGKTQLCNRLREPAREFEAECGRTEAFEVMEVPLKGVGPRGEDVGAWVFDFGGQPYLWSAHRFFLASQRNVYVVVIDGVRQGEQDLDYWLRYVRHYAGRGGGREGLAGGARRGERGGESLAGKIRKPSPQPSPGVPGEGVDGVPGEGERGVSGVGVGMEIPVLVVASKCDEEGFKDWEEVGERLEKEWSRLRVVRRYSSKSDEGLEEVKRGLRELVGGMEYVYTAKYSKAMGKVKQWLRGDEKASRARS